MWKSVVASLDKSRPVLIAGPTASGKSALAMSIAEHTGAPIVNADAIQVFSDWRILTARPSQDEETRFRHCLYGHVSGSTSYSVGNWLRDLVPILNGPPPVIVGGTGLYFMALTEGLASIPEVPQSVRAEADRRLRQDGVEVLLSELDSKTAFRIDKKNPVRIQRAWEVLTATGRGLADWQDETPPPLLNPNACQRLVMSAPKDWLSPRIERRFRQMLDQGVLDEACRNAPTWAPDLPSAKAIGATELIAHIRGEMTLETARERILTLTRQYSKRQRSWFRARMQGWRWLDPNE